MATYIVGDIQGCYSGLMRLLDKAEFCQQQDTLIAVGDLIGRGKEALQTLQFLTSLGAQFNTVLGNHDLHFLAVSQGVRDAKAEDRFDKLLSSSYREDYVQWLRQQPLALQLSPDTLVTHAGLYPQWSINKALKFSQRIHDKLVADEWVNLLANMYRPTTNQWQQGLSGTEKDNFIINAFTRMRFLTTDGELNLKAKSTPKETLASLIPWFEYNNPKLKPHQTVIFGHWAALNGETNKSQYIGLDTGYIWGNKLTLHHVESGCKISIKNKDF